MPVGPCVYMSLGDPECDDGRSVEGEGGALAPLPEIVSVHEPDAGLPGIFDGGTGEIRRGDDEPDVGGVHGPDHTDRFYGECCRLAAELRAERTALYAAYTAWCPNEVALVMSSRAFAARTRELVGRASPKEMKVSNQRKYYPGIGLLTDEERGAST